MQIAQRILIVVAVQINDISQLALLLNAETPSLLGNDIYVYYAQNSSFLCVILLFHAQNPLFLCKKLTRIFL